ncbi:MAG: hypothetical protein ACJAQT_003296 [Akkermansiaceae bacterium]|jgi:hypothetical protein
MALELIAGDFVSDVFDPDFFKRNLGLQKLAGQKPKEAKKESHKMVKERGLAYAKDRGYASSIFEPAQDDPGD